MKMGRKTDIPGLYETEDGHNLRVIVKVGSLKTEKRKKLPGSTKPEALAALVRLRREAERAAELKRTGTLPETVTAYAQRWCEDLGRRAKQGRITEGTVRTHVDNLGKFILPFFGPRSVRDVRPKDFNGYFRWLEELRKPEWRRGRNGTMYRQKPGPYSKSTLKSSWTTCKPFFRWITVHADLPRNPTAEVIFDVAAPAPKRKASLSRGEATALLAGMTEEPLKLRAQAFVAFVGAMRHSEASALHWSDVNLDEGYLIINRSVYLGVPGPPKTEGSRRLVALPRTVVNVLSELRAAQGGSKDPNARGDPRLFANSAGSYPATKSFNDALKRAAERAGILKNVSSHVLRRTTNNLVRRSAGSVVAMAMAGHVTEEMHRLYSEVDLGERADALRQAFGNALDGGDAVAPTVALVGTGTNQHPRRPGKRKRKTPDVVGG